MQASNHRATANSKRGRQMTSGGGKEFFAGSVSDEITAWNAAVEKKKQAKLLVAMVPRHVSSRTV